MPRNPTRPTPATPNPTRPTPAPPDRATRRHQLLRVAHAEHKALWTGPYWAAPIKGDPIDRKPSPDGLVLYGFGDRSELINRYFGLLDQADAELEADLPDNDPPKAA